MNTAAIRPLLLIACCFTMVALSCSGSDAQDGRTVDDPDPGDAGFDASPDAIDVAMVEDLVEVTCGEGVEQIDPRRSPELVEGCTRVVAAIHMPDYFAGDFETVSELRHAEKRFSIFRAHSPVDYGAFSNLKTVGGDLLIRQGDAGPADLHGFDSLETVEGPVVINSNAGLESLDGLQRLRRVGRLEIYGNTALRDITAIHGLVVEGDVRIALNPELTQQAIDAFIDSAEIGGRLELE